MSAINMECPEQFKLIAKILEFDSLFGMEFLNDKSRFIVCLCYKANEMYDDVKRLSNCQTLELYNVIGVTGFTVAWYEYHEIPSIYNALIKLKTSFVIRSNRMFNGYYANDESYNDFTYSPENMEKMLIRGMDNLLNTCTHNQFDMIAEELSRPTRKSIFAPWNYCTPEGVEFCKRMCNRFCEPFRSMNDKDNYKLLPCYHSL